MRKSKEKDLIHNESIISGYKDLCLALSINSRSGTHDADRKRFYRMAKKYGFPIHYKGNRVYMFTSDIETINKRYLLGMSVIAKYLEVHIKTLYKWLKRFPKMPIDREKEIAYIPELDIWYVTHIWNSHIEGRAFERFRKISYIKVDLLLNLLGLSHPKELKRYLINPKEKILA